MYFDNRGFGVGIAILACLCGVAGWAVIESALWVIGNLSITWGG